MYLNKLINSQIKDMKKEIKISEIRNYLGTGLLFDNIEDVEENLTSKMIGLNFQYLKVLSINDGCGNTTRFDNVQTIEEDLDCIKPHVRPLSQLAQEIEHEGEKIIPLDWLWNNCQRLSETIDYKELLVDSVNLDSIIEWLPVKGLDFLCKLHFDLFGWLKNDLAIEKNKI